MKQIIVAILFAASLVATGCVRRTVSSAPPGGAGAARSKNQYSGDDKVLEEKTIWFWQKDFRNPGN
jgi:hypothetical protein